ncbi:polyadenylate-binding protein 8 [Macadamia integrifolia]|uniref:polyadenylate-binding protein 8 n=1 Tax=Macadamia integrifolia TaxID=60698 RepID=UPI001C4FC4DC|nr:polyadenylate-binding protein 8 [Macadamia integrifolia]
MDAFTNQFAEFRENESMISRQFSMWKKSEQPIPMSALASALANATHEQKRTMSGESLYPLVDQLEHEMVAKVTGMLLEMDQTEVLHLLKSWIRPEALKAKVAEAMELLRNVQKQASSPTDQLASLSLGDNLVP